MSVLAVDAGQSGVRLRWSDAPHAVVELAGVRASGDVQQQLFAAIGEVVVAREWTPETIAVGLSGLAAADASPGLLLDTVRSAAQVLLAHDSVTSFLGALGPVDGAVVAAGTGVVTLASARSSVARVDGHGHLLGDAGSGFWLGRAGLDAVLRAHDRRAAVATDAHHPATSLVASTIEKFGPLDLVGPSLLRADNRVALIASFARTVLEAAAAGDATATAIVRGGAAELASSVHAALQSVDAPTDTPISWAGSLLGRSAIYREHTTAALAALRPHTTLTPPRGDGLDGAATLVDVPSTSPLYALVHRVHQPL